MVAAGEVRSSKIQGENINIENSIGNTHGGRRQQLSTTKDLLQGALETNLSASGNAYGASKGSLDVLEKGG